MKNDIKTLTIKTLFILVCALALTLWLCKVRADRQQEAKQERFQAGMRIDALMRSHDFQNLYPCLDSLQKVYRKTRCFTLLREWRTTIRATAPRHARPLPKPLSSTTL